MSGLVGHRGLLLGASGTPTTYDGAMLATSPWGYWKLDETSITGGSTAAADASGNGRAGLYVGTPWTTTAGLFAASTSCPNFLTNIAVTLPSFTLASLQKFTLIAWVKTTEATATVRSIIGGDDAGSNRRWQFRMVSGKLQFVTILPSTTTTASVASINDGNPHMVAAVFDPALSAGAGVVKLYIDGVLDNQSSTAITITAGSVTPAIGRRSATSMNDYWIGNIDNPAIIDTALSAGTIANLWSLRNSP